MVGVAALDVACFKFTICVSVRIASILVPTAVGTKMDAILTETQIVNLKHATSSAATPTTATTSVTDRFMVYSNQGNRPNLSVYDNKTQVNTTGTTVSFDATQNTMTINFASAPSNISINEKIRIAGEFVAGDAAPASHINGREFTVNNVSGNSITINTTGLSFPDDSYRQGRIDQWY